MALIEIEWTNDEVAVMTLNRPEKKNALSTELREFGNALMRDLAADESLKVLAVTGAGDVFSAGFDLREFDTAITDVAFAARLWASSDEWHRRWLTFPVPTIAIVNGAAIAGGFDIAVMCDLRVVAESATFAHPEIRFGDVVYGPLHDLVGGSAARDLCFTGRRIDAHEALRVGLANRVVRDDQVRDEGLALAGEIAQSPREQLVRLKDKAVRRAGVTQGATLDL